MCSRRYAGCYLPMIFLRWVSVAICRRLIALRHNAFNAQLLRLTCINIQYFPEFLVKLVIAIVIQSHILPIVRNAPIVIPLAGRSAGASRDFKL